ncbi:GNAT family N-acetyltransferase [Mycoplasmatota bacterium zrk1]
MEVIKLNEKYLEAFKEYCLKYRYVHDESFLYDDDLEKFELNVKNPTQLLLDENKICGVISLMIDEYFLKSKKARVRIFHCEKSLKSHYNMLLNGILPLEFQVDKLEMFLPRSLKETRIILEELLFNYYRTSFVMIRKDKPLIDFSFIDDYQLKPFRKGIDEEHYAKIRNRAFKDLKGNKTPITKEMVLKQYDDSYLLKDGMQILWHLSKPVGIVRMLRESDESGNYSFVAPIALIPEYQGKGLGGMLLRAGISIGQDNGINNSMLVVNGENENALTLYKREGYVIETEVSCYEKKID